MSMGICKTLPKRQGHRRYAALAVNSRSTRSFIATAGALSHSLPGTDRLRRTGNSGAVCGDTVPSGGGVVTPVYYTLSRSLGMFPGPAGHRRHLPLRCHSHPRRNGRQLLHPTSLACSNQSPAAGLRFQDTPPIYPLASRNMLLLTRLE